MAAPSFVQAGATLLSRNSVIRASATDAPGSGNFDDNEVITSFDRFADQVGRDDESTTGIVSLAHQYSVPGVMNEKGAGMQGAFGEGQARSAISGVLGNATSETGMQLLFQVDQQPTSFAIGAVIGATGNATVKVELAPLTAGTMESPLFAVSIDAGEAGLGGIDRSIDRSGLLMPGQYLLNVHANATDHAGDPAAGDAYYNFNFQLTAAPTGGAGGGAGSPAAVPLPPAVFGGGGMLAALAARRLFRRFWK